MKNYWDEFEYSKLKLLLNNEKVNSILDVRNGIKKMDERFPLSVELHLTDICNLKCEWCTDKELRKNGAVMDMDVVSRLFREFWRHGTGVTLEGGGEPTMHPEFHRVARIGQSNSLDMGLITNGTVDISNPFQRCAGRGFHWTPVQEKNISGKKELTALTAC